MDESIFGDTIFRYTRADGIRDGLLVDFNEGTLTSITRQYWKMPFAATIAVFDIIENAVGDGRTIEGILHDIFTMAQKGPGETIKVGVGEERHFQVIIGEKSYSMKVHVGPGDSPIPVLTLLLKEES